MRSKNFWVERNRLKFLKECQVFLFCFPYGPFPSDPVNTSKFYFGTMKLCRRPNWDLSKCDSSYRQVDGVGITHQSPFAGNMLWCDCRQQPIILPINGFLTVDLTHVRINNILIGDWL